MSDEGKDMAHAETRRTRRNPHPSASAPSAPPREKNSGWQTKKLGDVCAFLNRGISPKYLETGGVCVLNQKCVRDHAINYEPSRRHDSTAKAVNAERFIRLGDVLVNSTGTGTLGRVAQVREEPAEPTTVDSHVTIVRPKPGTFHLDFFGYMLVVIEDAIKEAGEGCGGQTELTRSVLAERFTVSYPESLPEQRRIVGILDEAFAGIATAKANAEKNLQNARALLESHLHAVFTHRGPGWVETTLGAVADFKNGLNYTKDSKGQTLRIVGVGDFQTNHIVPIDELGSVTIDGALSLDYALNEGDIVTVRSNGSKDLVGRCMIVPAITEVISYSGFIIRVRCKRSEVFPPFLLHFMKSSETRERLTRDGGGANISNINQGKLSPLPIALPPLPEQRRITARLDALQTETRRLEALYARKLAALDELKASLLHQAFSGHL